MIPQQFGVNQCWFPLDWMSSLAVLESDIGWKILIIYSVNQLTFNSLTPTKYDLIVSYVVWEIINHLKST